MLTQNAELLLILEIDLMPLYSLCVFNLGLLSALYRESDVGNCCISSSLSVDKFPNALRCFYAHFMLKLSNAVRFSS